MAPPVVDSLTEEDGAAEIVLTEPLSPEIVSLEEPNKEVKLVVNATFTQAEDVPPAWENALLEIQSQDKEDEDLAPNAPNITIREITATGLVVFSFSEEMWVIPDDELDLIKSSIV